MVGLIAVAMRESETGLTAMQLLTSPQVGMPLLAALFVYASLVPILAGAKMEPFGECEFHIRSGCQCPCVIHLVVAGVCVPVAVQ